MHGDLVSVREIGKPEKINTSCLTYALKTFATSMSNVRA